MNTISTPNEESTSNTGGFQKLMDDATELGKASGKGKDTQVQFYLKVFDGAYHGHIDMTKDKHGIGTTDALKLTEAYVLAQQGATVFDAKASNQRVATSKTMQCIKAGGWTQGGSGEPLQTANNLINIRQKLRADPHNSKKLNDAGHTFLVFCRTLLKSNRLPNDAELRRMCFKPEHQSQTEEEFAEALRKKVNKMKLKASQIESMFADTLVRACTKRLTEIAKANPIVGAPKAV